MSSPRAATNCQLTQGIFSLESHVDEALYHSADPRLIYEPQECGSCSSLVTRTYRCGHLDRLAAKGQCNELIPEVARLLFSAILVDTHNLDPSIGKAKAVDHESATMLASRANVPLAVEDASVMTISTDTLKSGVQSFNACQFHHALSKAKNDVSGLDTMQLLTRDYKQYEWDGPDGTKWHVGLGTVPANLESWISREGKDKFLAGCQEFSEQRQIGLLGILTSFTNLGSFQREVALYSTSGRIAFQQFIQTASENTKDSLDLEPIPEINDSLQGGDNLIYAWKQRQTRSTRKQVAPAFQNVASQVRPADSTTGSH